MSDSKSVATDDAKDDIVRLEKIRLKEVQVRIVENLRYLDCSVVY